MRLISYAKTIRALRDGILVPAGDEDRIQTRQTNHGEDMRDDFFEELPCLEQLLQAKPEFPHMIERALRQAADDIHDPNKPAAAKRVVKITITMLPEADRGSVRVSMTDPEVTEARQPSVAAQMSLIESDEGVQLHAQNVGQTTIGKGLDVQ